MERSAPAAAEALSLCASVDAALPWNGLPLACLHEVMATDTAGGGFCAMLLGRLACRGPVLWCLNQGDPPYAPGLAAYGLSPDRLLLAACPDDREVLWTMEEALRCPAVGGVVGEVRSIDFTAGRRLQLAAEAGGVTGLLLLPAEGRSGGGATTRWRVAASASRPTPWGGLGPARWHLALERCRGGMPRTWTVEWREDEQTLTTIDEDGCQTEDLSNPVMKNGTGRPVQRAGPLPAKNAFSAA